jgi:Ni,Fe-hydrogenase III large subunit
MSYKIPMGPYHPALEEPYKLDMICEGETVIDAKLHIGFNFRGIEHLAETRNYIQVIALMPGHGRPHRPNPSPARPIHPRHHGGA